jgi:hypothetical protein
MVAPKLLVHFGYDMRLIVASSMSLAGPPGQIRSSGLFVYDSEASLPAIEAWGTTGGPAERYIHRERRAHMPGRNDALCTDEQTQGREQRHPRTG